LKCSLPFLPTAQLLAHSNVDNPVHTLLRAIINVVCSQLRNFLHSTAQEVAHFFGFSRVKVLKKRTEKTQATD
jgi:hypothetical protein